MCGDKERTAIGTAAIGLTESSAGPKREADVCDIYLQSSSSLFSVPANDVEHGVKTNTNIIIIIIMFTTASLALRNLILLTSSMVLLRLR